MQEELKKVYKCDHCQKKMFRKKSMEKHEEFCSKNPKNIPDCFGCVHLTNHSETFEHFYEAGGEIESRDCKIDYPFFCKKQQFAMHNKKFEMLHPKYCKELETELMPMLQTCSFKQKFK